MSQPSACFITPTWSGDLEHFRLLRASLDKSALAQVPHYVIVQTEDLDAFREFTSPAIRLKTTADVLPPKVETIRKHSRYLSRRLGRHLTRISGSARRALGWPRWPAYTGWHTQQICKLKVAHEANEELAIVIDSDVLVTPNASLEDFYTPGAVRCFATWERTDAPRGKVRKWIDQAEKLTGHQPLRPSTLGDKPTQNGEINTYFDTPFILDKKVLNALIRWLEDQYTRPWWQTLLAQPPRRWSEFGIYKAFLAGQTVEPIDWQAPSMMRYLFDASDVNRLAGQVECFMTDPEVHFITIHSQSSGRQPWSAADYGPAILSIIENTHASRNR